MDRGDIFVELFIDAGEGKITKSSEKGKLDGIFRAFTGWLPDEQAEAVIRCWRRWGHTGGGSLLKSNLIDGSSQGSGMGNIWRDSPSILKVYAKISLTTRPCTSVSRKSRP